MFNPKGQYTIHTYNVIAMYLVQVVYLCVLFFLNC